MQISNRFFYLRPIEAQHDSHIASIIARKNVERLKLKQRRLRTIFSLHPSQVYNIGESVLLRKKRTIFHKKSRFGGSNKILQG